MPHQSREHLRAQWIPGAGSRTEARHARGSGSGHPWPAASSWRRALPGQVARRGRRGRPAPALALADPLVAGRPAGADRRCRLVRHGDDPGRPAAGHPPDARPCCGPRPAPDPRCGAAAQMADDAPRDHDPPGAVPRGNPGPPRPRPRALAHHWRAITGWREEAVAELERARRCSGALESLAGDVTTAGDGAGRAACPGRPRAPGRPAEPADRVPGHVPPPAGEEADERAGGGRVHFGRPADGSRRL
ncbi:hypothetical protein SAMN06272737_11311 [Blastococcus mobilis]|uniref:Uncharacterized protein n=1 Tax=Blastococcus mobilis TaxID=1938746 RepID=A0A238XG55_9ACTN|nr:hypothetical protein SAMN06272737_11311 [Blastococcus mobilis]